MIKDVTIIGGGPVGIYAATYAGIRSMSVNLIESMHSLGGQLSALYPEKYIYDLPGFDQIKANDYIDCLIKQMNHSADEYVETFLNLEIVSIVKKDGYFELKSQDKKIFESKTVLLTIGNGVFSPRKIGLSNEETFNNILYSINNLDMFKNKEITVLGGGDSALDWVLMLEKYAKKVNIVHRRDEYRAKEDSIKKLDDSNVNQYMSYLVEKLEGSNNKLESINIKHKESDEIVKLKQDYLIVNYGNENKINNFETLNLERNDYGYLVLPTLETNIDGIYACGNATYYEGKPKQITVGLGEALVAINSIKGYIDPSSKDKIFYSSLKK